MILWSAWHQFIACHFHISIGNNLEFFVWLYFKRTLVAIYCLKCKTKQFWFTYIDERMNLNKFLYWITASFFINLAETSVASSRNYKKIGKYFVTIIEKNKFSFSKNSCAIYYMIEFDFQNYAMGNINRIQYWNLMDQTVFLEIFPEDTMSS